MILYNLFGIGSFTTLPNQGYKALRRNGDTKQMTAAFHLALSACYSRKGADAKATFHRNRAYELKGW